MNAGPKFQFNEAISFVINCDNQDEVDYYWQELTANGGQESMCGWLKDPFGVSWQVVPRQLTKLLNSEDGDANERAVKAMLSMKKLNINKLINARKAL